LLDKRTEIFNSARELFYSQGFKDTNISDIAKMTGIGVGTFYKYYSSKEELFCEIYLKENHELKKYLLETVDLDQDPVLSVSKFVTQNITAINSNLILKEWYNRELFSKLEQYFYEQGGLECFADFISSGKMEFIKKWKAEGKIRPDLSDHMIMAMFNAILYIDIHKTEIGLEHFPQILHYITEFIMKGLTGSHGNSTINLHTGRSGLEKEGC